MVEPLLQFEGVRLVAPDGREVFHHLDWSVATGQRLRIAGEPGSGGTALLRLAAGLAHPSEGRVLLEGVPHEAHRFRHAFLRSGAVAWIPLDGGLVSNLDLLANVALPARYVRGMRREDAERLAAHWIERLGLERQARKRPHALEPRDRQLGALARALCMEARLWLLDRPMDAMDSATLARAQEAMDWILKRPDTTLLMVGEGRRYAPLGLEVWRLREGRLNLEGPP